MNENILSNFKYNKKGNLTSFDGTGPKIYDPRDNTYKYSSNPGLIILNLIDRKLILTEKTPSMELICKMADLCDKDDDWTPYNIDELPGDKG